MATAAPLSTSRIEWANGRNGERAIFTQSPIHPFPLSPPHPSLPQPVERLSDAGEQLVDFSARDRERRRERDDVADAANDHAFLARERRAFDAEHHRRSERRFAAARHQLERADEIDAAHFTHGAVLAEAAQLLLKIRTDVREHARDEA